MTTAGMTAPIPVPNTDRCSTAEAESVLPERGPARLCNFSPVRRPRHAR